MHADEPAVPPCVVTMHAESLEDWLAREQPEKDAALAALAGAGACMTDMHDILENIAIPRYLLILPIDSSLMLERLPHGLPLPGMTCPWQRQVSCGKLR
jgi:hypothetical protein